MKRSEAVSSLSFGLTPSTPDANRLYSILLDARASSASETIYDIAEKILVDEKENAKNALDKLWALKKNVLDGQDTGTIDLLIDYYQDKLDVLREREEHIKKVSRESRDLLEEKRKQDTDIATVKQEIDECTTGISRLTQKLDKAKIREQELILIESQLKKELSLNANEVVNGLYEIILSHARVLDSARGDASAAAETNATGVQGALPPQVSTDTESIPVQEVRTENVPVQTDPFVLAMDGANSMSVSSPEIFPDSSLGDAIESEVAQIHALYQTLARQDVDDFPKSVVKTTRGIVIGEYFYDPHVYKNKRHYVFNGLYFMEQLTRAMQVLRQRYDQTVHAEAMQMVQDALKRILESPNLHFEIAVSEIVNEKNLRELWRTLKEKQYVDAILFCNRLKGKIAALGGNYRTMLREQMQRLHEGADTPIKKVNLNFRQACAIFIS